MIRMLLSVFVIALLFGCSTVKDVGVGMQVGGAGSATPLGGAVSLVGSALQVGSNAYSGNQDDTLSKIEIPLKNWSKHSLGETDNLVLYRKGLVDAPSKIAEYNAFTKLVSEVSRDAETGKFKFNSKHEFDELVKSYENGNWVSFPYLDQNLTIEGITLFCHKDSDKCIVAVRGDDVVLPVLKKSTISIKKALNGSKVGVGEFTSYEPKLKTKWCRLISISATTYGAETFADIFKNSMIEELKEADAYSPISHIVLKGYLKEMELSTFGSAYWDIALEISSSNGKSLTVSNKFPFESSMSAKTACENASGALEPAFSSVLQKAINSPELEELIK